MDKDLVVLVFMSQIFGSQAWVTELERTAKLLSLTRERLEYIGPDELVEITPQSIPLRKVSKKLVRR